MNSVHIIGNITRDVELTYAQSGTAIGKIGVAVNKQVKNAQGGYDSKPVFIDVTAFGKTAETLNQYFRKGSKIGIDGELNFEQWEDQSGQKRSKLSVIMNRLHFIDKKDDSQQGSQQQQPQQQYGQQQQQAQPQNQQQGQQQYGQPQQQPAQNQQQPQQQYQPQQQQAPQGQQQQAQPQQSYQPQRQAPNPQQQGQLPQNNGQQAQQQIDEDQIPF